MAYAADDGHGRLHYGPSQLLVIKSPQIFHGTAAAHQQQHIDFIALECQLQRGTQLASGLRALHGCRVNYHRYVRHPALQG